MLNVTWEPGECTPVYNIKKKKKSYFCPIEFITQSFTCNLTQIMGEKTQHLSYSKSKPTAVGAGRHKLLDTSTNGERRSSNKCVGRSRTLNLSVRQWWQHYRKDTLFCHPWVFSCFEILQHKRRLFSVHVSWNCLLFSVILEATVLVFSPEFT